MSELNGGPHESFGLEEETMTLSTSSLGVVGKAINRETQL